jgi:hypothetical protein
MVPNEEIDSLVPTQLPEARTYRQGDRICPTYKFRPMGSQCELQKELRCTTARNSPKAMLEM